MAKRKREKEKEKASLLKEAKCEEDRLRLDTVCY